MFRLFRGSSVTKSEKSTLETVKSAGSAHLNRDSEALAKAFDSMNAFLDDNMVLTNKILSEDNGGVYYKVAGTLIVFLEALLGFEAETIKKASETASEAEGIALKKFYHAERENIKTTVNFKAGTEYNIAYSEVHLMNAVLLLLSESVIGSMKALYKLQSSYKILHEIYSNNEIIHVDPEDYNGNKTVQVDENYEGNLVDEYVISGTRVCFGILHLILSSIPPNISKILSVIGLYGDRKLGLSLLWAASQAPNIHGTLAVFGLLQYFGGPAQVCDIETPTVIGPMRHIEQVLKITQARFSNSALWTLQTARMDAAHGRISEAIALMEEPRDIQMKQIEALLIFEKGMDCLYVHEYDKSAKAFTELISLNSWSPGLYAYVAAVCHIEMYRETASQWADNKDDKLYATAMDHKSKAGDLLDKVASYCVKKRFIQRGFPFKGYLERKLQKWKTRLTNMNKETHNKFNYTLIDAVGISPVNEIVYVWNGYKRMSSKDLERTLKNIRNEKKLREIQADRFYPQLAFMPLDGLEKDQKKHEEKECKEIDEIMIQGVIESAILRHLDRNEESIEILEKDVLANERIVGRGGSKDEWPCAAGLYERGVLAWESKQPNSKEEATKYFKAAAEYKHDYDLSSRIGMRVQTAMELVKSGEDKDS